MLLTVCDYRITGLSGDNLIGITPVQPEALERTPLERRGRHGLTETLSEALGNVGR